MISLMVAYDPNKVIGYKGALPWHYKEDLAYFKKVTQNHKCVMGRITYDSILDSLKKPLPNRENLVVTRQDLDDKRVTLIHDLETFLEVNKDRDEEIFVIGGSQIFDIALPYADRLYITHIKKAYDGDTYFPSVDFSDYQRIYFDDRDNLSFAIYERKH